MKILFIVTQSEFGGAQKYIYEIATHLNPDKYKITVAAGIQGNNKHSLLSRLRKKGIKTYLIKHLKREINPYYDLRAFFEIEQLIKTEKPDIIFLNSTKAGFLGSMAAHCSKLKIPVIYRIGGWAFNEPKSYLIKKFYLLTEKISAPWKDIIINNSKFEKDQAIKLGIKPKKEIVTIYNGIDFNQEIFLEKNKAKNILLKKIKKIKPEIELLDKKIVGTIANLYFNKGLISLIEAAEQLFYSPYLRKNLDFIIIGQGRQEKHLRKLIKKYDLENDVFIINDLPNASRYLKAFDIFVLPSLKEGMPWAVLEAMTAGLPIIATKVGALPEMLISNSKQYGFLIKPNQPKHLAEAILNLIHNSKFRKKMGKLAQKQVKEKFNLEKMVESTEKTIQSLLK